MTYPHVRTRRRKSFVAPALQPWLWCLIFVAGVLAVYFGFVVDQLAIPRPQGFVTFINERLNTYLERGVADPNARRVVLLGSSRLKYATELNDDELAPNQPRALDQFNNLRIVVNAADFEDFRPFTDRLIASRPNVVVIELEVIARQRRPRPRSSRVRDYLKWLAFDVGPWTANYSSERTMQVEKPCKPETREEIERAICERRDLYLLISDAPSDKPTLVEWFITAAASQGARVLLLDIPVTATIEPVFAEQRDHAMSLAVKKLGGLKTVSIVRYPNATSDSMFCDTKHLNDEARASFSNWLATVIQGGQ